MQRDFTRRSLERQGRDPEGLREQDNIIPSETRTYWEMRGQDGATPPCVGDMCPILPPKPPHLANDPEIQMTSLLAEKKDLLRRLNEIEIRLRQFGR